MEFVITPVFSCHTVHFLSLFFLFPSVNIKGLNQCHFPSDTVGWKICFHHLQKFLFLVLALFWDVSTLLDFTHASLPSFTNIRILNIFLLAFIKSIFFFTKINKICFKLSKIDYMKVKCNLFNSAYPFLLQWLPSSLNHTAPLYSKKRSHPRFWKNYTLKCVCQICDTVISKVMNESICW